MVYISYLTKVLNDFFCTSSVGWKISDIQWKDEVIFLKGQWKYSACYFWKKEQSHSERNESTKGNLQ